MRKIEKYSSYKDSGVAWLGEIPEDWIKVKLKWISKIYAGGTPDKDNLKYWENGNIPWIASGEVNQGIVTKPTTNITEIGFKNSSARWIPKDSLIVALAGQGKTKGMVAYLDIDTTGNQSLSAVIPNKKKISSKYLYYFIKGAYKELRGSAGEGQRDGLNLEKLGVLTVIYPSKEEQTKIASFLDEKTAQIDEVISQKEKLIELLKERKQIVINDTVTKGLDKDVEFVDSGVEWIGKIPKHWKLERLGSNFIERREKVSDKDFEPLSVTKNGVVPQLDSAAKSNDGDNRKLVRKGDFVINSRSDRKGSSGLSKLDGSVSLINIVLQPINLNSDFSHILLKSNGFIEEFYRNGHGIVADLWTTRFWDMKSIMLAIPPKDEQVQIIEYIETQITKIDKAIELQQNYISKLKEYKASLIDSVVTGKVKVS